MNYIIFVSAAIRALHAFYALAGSGTLTSSGLLGLPGGPLLSNALAELGPQLGIRTLPHVFGQHIARGIKSIADVVSLRLSAVVIPFPSVLNNTLLSEDGALASEDQSSPGLVPGLTPDNVILWASSNETFKEPQASWSTSDTLPIAPLPVCEFKGLELLTLTDVCSTDDQLASVDTALGSAPSATLLPTCEFKVLELAKFDVCSADDQPTSVDQALRSTLSAASLPTCELKVLELAPPEFCAAGDQPTSVDVFRPQVLANIPLKARFARSDTQDFKAWLLQLLPYVYFPTMARVFGFILVSVILWNFKGRIYRRKPRHVYVSLDHHLLDNVLLVNLSPPEMHGSTVLEISLASSTWLPSVPSTLLPLLPSKKGNEHALLTVLPLNNGEEDFGYTASAPVLAPDADEEIEALPPANNEEPIGYTARIQLPLIRLGKGTEYNLLAVLPLVNNEEDLALAANTPLPAPDAEEEFEHALLVGLPPVDDDELVGHAASIPLPPVDADEVLGHALLEPLPPVDDDEVFGHAIAMPLPAPGANEVLELAELEPSPPADDEEFIGYTARIDLPPIRLGKGTEHNLLTVLPLVDNEEDSVLVINIPTPTPDVDEVLEHTAIVPSPRPNDEELIGYTTRTHLPPIRLEKGTECNSLTVLPLVDNEEDPVLVIKIPTHAPDVDELFEDAVLMSLPPATDDEVNTARKRKNQLKRHRKREREAAESEKMAVLALSLAEIGSLLPIEPQVSDRECLVASLDASNSEPGLDSVLYKKTYWRERYDKESQAQLDDFRRLSVDALLLAGPRALSTEGARTDQHLHLDLAGHDPSFLALLISVRGRCPLPDIAEIAEMTIPRCSAAKPESISQDVPELTLELLLEEGPEAFLHDFTPTSHVVMRTKAQKRADLRQRQREEASKATPTTDSVAANPFTVLEVEEGLNWATECDAADALHASQPIDVDAPSQHLTATQQRNQRRRNKERAERHAEESQSSEESSSHPHSSNKKAKKKSSGKKKPGSARPVFGIHLQR
ncbi:hypothetical protein CONPUDRAFT_153981 [Coniophora puteana RWD-64-598 SS2]|uniref:Uncharacterized protein n=1 Tax=Coniophora puteana (strain RWD-64-598) TaxID=741705 RepID=A0A5M3MRQ7_CONPW|nr:uncharacterized protein CONPUDRAFT_153981 [Coniophora puteana RWD-64-598 SS2]EIW81434.1 hypothetical protein CONPUDRAFT_153981 [Coniophora puteana RWD-64-598 SS2]